MQVLVENVSILILDAQVHIPQQMCVVCSVNSVLIQKKLSNKQSTIRHSHIGICLYHKHTLTCAQTDTRQSTGSKLKIILLCRKI